MGLWSRAIAYAVNYFRSPAGTLLSRPHRIHHIHIMDPLNLAASLGSQQALPVIQPILILLGTLAKRSPIRSLQLPPCHSLDFTLSTTFEKCTPG